MTPEDFISHWSPGGGSYSMNERAGAQVHFMGLCALLGVDAPNHSDDYTFEKGTLKIGQRRGFADVFKRGCFGWEYKAPGGDLTAALRQLKDYANALDNPPLLIVSDRLVFEIHTQFTGRPTETYRIALKNLGDPAQRELLRRAFVDPASFQPKRTNRDITEVAAKAFAEVAERMRGASGGDYFAERREPPERVAHFLTQCLFCFFAEDVGLLPERLFEKLVAKQITPDKLRGAMIELFEKMRSGGLFGAEDIPWFNGGLFQTIDVPMLTPMDVAALKTASTLNWSSIDVAVFGTLFERGLDPKKRSQLGAHYTDPATIMRIVTPVVERPLRAEWEAAKVLIEKALARSKNRGANAPATVRKPYLDFLQRLTNYRVLDPACGSGNFLYVALKTLKDIEHSVHVDAEALGLQREIELVVSPANVLGIELNDYAAELARVTVWIGELQWRLNHGYPFKQNPVLEPLDHIECRDALLTYATVFHPSVGSADTSPTRRGGLQDNARAKPPLPEVGEVARSAGGVHEAPWPRADAVIGNPPFVGGSKKRRELGDETFEALAKIYAGRVPPGADLVCYWFDKALQQMKRGEVARAGLVATQSIRAGSNRVVLDAICQGGKIFNAWGDEPWINDGAAVRVSLVCFANGVESSVFELDGKFVPAIFPDLSAGVGADITTAIALSENKSTVFKGPEKSGSFEIVGSLARRWLADPNPHGRSNAEVIVPWVNGNAVTDRSKDLWIVDFGIDTTAEAAALFGAPFAHVVSEVQPERLKNGDAGRRKHWWRFGRNGADFREAVASLSRFIATSRVAKYRTFLWLYSPVSPDSRLALIARSDDASFGILHSRIHEVWSLATASMHGVGNDPTYNAKSCFETFPFPAGLTPRDTAHQRTETLADGAVIPAGLAPSPLAGDETHLSPAGSGGEGGRGVDSDVGAAAKLPPHPNPLPPGERGLNPLAPTREHAINIARAAKRLNDLRERWLNPPEWTERVGEVIPLGMDVSPYPDRVLPRANLAVADLAELKKRTLTNLYNQRPAWLADAHALLDAAVAAAYGWTDFSAATTDNEILARLLALNQARATVT